MHFSLTTVVTYLALATSVLAGPASDPLEARAIGQSCKSGFGTGTCQKTSSCTTQGFNIAGKCPGAKNVQCCVKKTCSTSSGKGLCLNTSDGCSGGSFVSGACPGPNSVKCCVKGSKPKPPPSTGGGSGAAVVKAAQSKKGLPYVWGGGGCKGPSGGGFDCSGLTQYSICKAKNNKKIPRTADQQYHSGMGKHFPRSQAKAGDMLFWGKGGCGKGHVKHVGIYMRSGWMVNAAKTGTPVREQSIWISSGGLHICPDAVRFW